MYTDIDNWEHIASGKVRELYAPKGVHPLGDVVLMVATDRISAFDFILDTEIPGKGVILTQMTLLWFEALAKRLDIPNHFVTEEGIPPQFAGRGIICKRLKMVPVECVARGFLTGSAFAEYQETGGYQEFKFPQGLEDGAKLDEPIFTPAMKAEVGNHDENITFQKMTEAVGEDLAETLRDYTLSIFKVAGELAEKAGMTLVDTKFEFGIDPETNEVTLGDEILTPDSSRYWNEDKLSYDKQYVRSWLLNDSGWDKKSGELPPALPKEVVEKTVELYEQALEKLKKAI